MQLPIQSPMYSLPLFWILSCRMTRSYTSACAHTLLEMHASSRVPNLALLSILAASPVEVVATCSTSLRKRVRMNVEHCPRA